MTAGERNKTVMATGRIRRETDLRLAPSGGRNFNLCI